MLDLLSRFVQANETMHISYQRRGDGSVRLLIQPSLNDDADMVIDADAQAARVALSRPVVFTGNHADVAARFAQFVAANADARGELKRAYDTLTEATKGAAKKAAQAVADKNAASSPKGKKQSAPNETNASSASATTDAAPTGDTDSHAAPGEQPDDLFGV